MLSKNNHSSCAFGEQIVSYIYDEASAKEKNEFEAHLPNCLMCADEIAGFGLVRSSINEWRKDELFTLESPALKIPALTAAKAAQTTVISKGKDSWLDEFRKLFTVSPAWAASFAAVIISIGLIWVFFGASQNETIANKPVDIPPVSPIVPAKQNETEQVAVNPKVEKTTVVPNNVSPVENISNVPRNQVKNTVNRTPKSKTVSPKMNQAVADNKPNTNKTDKSNNVQKPSTPTLSGMTDEEDKSLRLAELFDELDTK